ncbi:MAG: DUF927 domain-containing protein [Clostridia bacterium]|nr:DUF927 domain-containing protein [Clostridia bacterium]
MNKNLEEKLLEENPPYNLEELNSESILEDYIFDYLIALPNSPNKTRIIEKIRTKAKELKVIRAFNSIFKQKNQEYIHNLKSRGGNVVKFTDCPIEDLKCGQWNADDTGVYKMDYTPTMQSLKIKACPHPIIPIEIINNIDTNTEKVKLAFYKRKQWQYAIVERKTIASNTAIIQLANRGIEVNSENAKNLVSYLADIIELNNLETTDGITHLGWINKDFIPYTSKYKYDGDVTYKNIFESVSEKGNYQKWKDTMKQLRANSRTLRFLMASSFASTLVKLFQINPFVVHLWGKSSNGKTVAQMICASIWGNPAKGKLLSSLDSTKVASERLCNFLRSIPLILDELQITRTKYKNYDTLIYELTEGKGKDRGTVEGGLTQITEWDNIIIVSGEEPITSSTSKEGVKNRVIEIEENEKIVENGNEVVNLILNNYGFAGKEFIEIIQNKDNLFDEYNQIVSDLKKDENSPKQINAIATILLADKIVSKSIFNDNSITLEEAKDYFTKDIDEADRYIDLIIDIANANINNFYDSNNSFPPSGQVWGKLDKTTDGKGTIMYYDFVPTKLYQILEENNINWNGIKKKMADKGYVVKSAEGNYQVPVRMPNGVQKIIRIKNINFSVTTSN